MLFLGGVFGLMGEGDLLGGDSIASNSLWSMPGGMGSLFNPLGLGPFVPSLVAPSAGAGGGNGGVGGRKTLVPGKAMSFNFTEELSDGIGMSSISMGTTVLSVVSKPDNDEDDDLKPSTISPPLTLLLFSDALDSASLDAASAATLFSRSFLSSWSRFCLSFTNSANKLVSVILFLSCDDLIECGEGLLLCLCLLNKKQVKIIIKGTRLL